jgi:hypothetical protein
MKAPALILVLVAALAPTLTVRVYAQSDELPLGDVARSYRKSQTPPQTVIDNDNLPDMIEDGEAHKWATTTLRFSLDQSTLQMLNASPDVTCALAFNAQSNPRSEEKPQTLPASELAKLDGPASIVGDDLQVSVYNGSAWDVREITVGVTIVKKTNAPATAPYVAMKLLPASLTEPVMAERHPDAMVLYHLKGTAAPLTTTLFRQALTAPLPPGQEWHWAILQAKGIPPAPPPTPPPAPTAQASN